MTRSTRFTFAEILFVWVGGGLFVSSLALTGWAYAFWFAEPAAPVSPRAIGWDAALLSAFALHHSALARSSAKKALTAVVPERLLRSMYVWVASLLLMLVCLAWQNVGGEVYRASSGWLVSAHALVQMAGVWLIAVSVRAIDALELAGIRAGTTENAGSDALQVSGPYRLVRHPLYLGWMLIVFGASHLTGDRLTFAILTSAYLVVAIPWEERSLEDTFGDAYARYRQHVRWRVLPYLY